MPNEPDIEQRETGVRILATLALSAASSAATAMDFRTEVVDLRPLFPLRLSIEMTGPIVDGDSDRLAMLLASELRPEMRDVSVQIESPGGSLVEGLQIARILQGLAQIVSAQVGTEDRPDAECASACVLAWIGADLRYVTDGARIGVHQFGFSGGDVDASLATDISQRFASEITGLLQDQRIDLALFDRMAATRPEDIDWVPHETLVRWRAITGPVFDERMEYRNMNGRIALHMVHESLYGVNQMTLTCGDGLVAYAVLDEPELAMMGSVRMVVDGRETGIPDFQLVNRDGGRTRVLFRVPDILAADLASAASIGARVYTPGGDLFWGFAQTVRDAKLKETVEGCLRARPDPRDATLIPSVDFPGNDLTTRGVRDVSLEACTRICQSDPSCKAFSYVEAQRWCWPKARAANPTSAAGITSGVLR